jgi:hypothetical protein
MWNRLVLLLHKFVFESVNIIDNEAMYQRIHVAEVQISTPCMVLVAMMYVLQRPNCDQDLVWQKLHAYRPIAENTETITINL